MVNYFHEKHEYDNHAIRRVGLKLQGNAVLYIILSIMSNFAMWK